MAGEGVLEVPLEKFESEENSSTHESINQHVEATSDNDDTPKPRAALAFMEVLDIAAASYGENGKRCYKVQWKESWVYEDHLFDCEQLIQRFWQQQPEKNDQVRIVGSATKRTREKANESNINAKRVRTTNDDVTIIVMGSSPNKNNAEEEGHSTADQEWHLGDEVSNDAHAELDWTFKSSPSKNQQIRYEMKKREIHICHICGEEFQMVTAIRKHYREIHPESKPFSCEMCGKRFDRKENLSRHIRIHTGDRRYICNHCGKGYTDPSGLKKHVISKHSTDTYPCEVCSASFKLKDSLTRHLVKHLADVKNKKHLTVLADQISEGHDEEESVAIAKSDASNHLEENPITSQDEMTKEVEPNQLQDFNVLTLQHYTNSTNAEVQFIKVSNNESLSQDESAEAMNEEKSNEPSSLNTAENDDLDSSKLVSSNTAEPMKQETEGETEEQIISIQMITPIDNEKIK